VNGVPARGGSMDGHDSILSRFGVSGNPGAVHYLDRLTRKHGKAKALTVLAHWLARAVYHILQRRTPFDQDRFLANTA
jgi:hypothetical protein